MVDPQWLIESSGCHVEEGVVDPSAALVGSREIRISLEQSTAQRARVSWTNILHDRRSEIPQTFRKQSRQAIGHDRPDHEKPQRGKLNSSW